MREDRGRGRDLLSLAVFGPAAALVYWLAFRPPGGVQRLLGDGSGLGLAVTVAFAAAAAWCCRRVVQALLRLCGF
jgi:hypothetical protein